MGRLQIKATDCKFQEYDRRLKEKFTIGLNEIIIAKIIRANSLERYEWGKEWPSFNVGLEGRSRHSIEGCVEQY